MSKNTKKEETVIKKDNKLIFVYLAIIAIVFGIVYSKIYDDKLFIGGDNASYYILGKSIAEGKGYANIDRVNASPANHFPPGYPAIVATIMKTVGQDIDNVKVTNGLFLLGGLILLLLLINKITDNIHLAFAVCCMLLFNFHLLQYSTWMMSEMSFFFFSTLSILFFLRMLDDDHIFKSPNFYVFIASLIITYYIRTVGLAWLGAAIIVLAIQRNWKALAATVAAFVICYLPWYIRGKNLGGNSYMNQLTMKNPYRPEEGAMEGLGDWWLRFTTNLERYLGVLIPNGIFGVNETKMNADITTSNVFLGLIIIAIIIFGLWKLKQIGFMLFAYLGASFLILCLWPEVWYDYRFIVTLIPIMTFMFGFGLFELAKLGMAKAGMDGNASWVKFTPLALFLLVPKLSNSISALEQVAKTPFPPAYKNYFNLAEWCDKNTEKDAVITCRKGNLFFLFSNRATTGYRNTKNKEELIDKLAELGVDYVVVDQLGFSSTGLYLVPAIQKHPEKFKLVRQLKNPDTYLFKTQFDMGYNGEYKDELKHGKGTFKWPDGRIYTGEWKNDKMNGEGKMTLSNGQYLEGTWQDDRLNGAGVMYDANGTIIQKGIWKDDKFIGQID